jgi:hypothetical protein
MGFPGCGYVEGIHRRHIIGGCHIDSFLDHLGRGGYMLGGATEKSLHKFYFFLPTIEGWFGQKFQGKKIAHYPLAQRVIQYLHDTAIILILPSLEYFDQDISVQIRPFHRLEFLPDGGGPLLILLPQKEVSTLSESPDVESVKAGGLRE